MLVLGIDEVGRGSLAGPLVVGAVVIDKPIKGLRDSKLLSRNQRLTVNDLIYQKAVYIGLGWVQVEELDSLGLTRGLTLASERALEQLDTKVDRVILDGNFNYLKGIDNCELIIKADRSIAAVSAASIVAKVARDSYMIALAKHYPQYMFENNVGYGTSAHLKALAVNGPCIHHRRSFNPVKSLIALGNTA